MPRSDSLQITAQQPGIPLTPARKRFNTLIRQIEQSRQALAAWQDGIVAYRQSYASLLQPLQTQLLQGQRQWVHLLDAAIGKPGWTKAERGLLRELLCEAAGELLEGQGDDPVLKALYDKHAELDFDTEQREAVRAMKDLAEMMTGLDLGDDDGLDSDEDLFKRMEQSVRQQWAQKAADAADEADETADAPGAGAGRPSQRRSPGSGGKRKTAAQQRREAEAQQVTQSVREIYRKLASALHPDRQTDAAQREAHTALMQRVNQAYEAQDLLTLLELQLQIEQIDAGHMASASEAKVKHYNKVLGEQLAELKAEIESVEMTFRMEFGLHPGWGLNPAKLGLVLEQTRREWQADLALRLQQHRTLEDQAATKRWLKSVRKQRREEDFDDMPF
jgi:curved DNA-binding protein CbpA